jgi:hypothetical protein
MLRRSDLRSRAMLPLSLAGALLLTAGCDSSSTDLDDPTPTATTFSVYLTDAPGDVADVWVEIADVRLVGSGPPVSILDEPTGLINLLELQGTSMVLVEEAEVEPGPYSQLRFVVSGAVLETTDGQVFTLGGAQHPGGLSSTGSLLCPSCGQSGLKVNFAGGLEIDDGENAAMVDFDVSQSFGRQAGQSGRWVMHPVIQGVVTDPGTTVPVTGTVVGQVVLGTDGEGAPVQIPACGGEERGVEAFIPTATSTTLLDDEGDPFTFTASVEASGDFTLSVLDADTYALGYLPVLLLDGEALTWTADVDPGSVEVALNETVDGVVFTITSATCSSTD